MPQSNKLMRRLNRVTPPASADNESDVSQDDIDELVDTLEQLMQISTTTKYVNIYCGLHTGTNDKFIRATNPSKRDVQVGDSIANALRRLTRWANELLMCIASLTRIFQFECYADDSERPQGCREEHRNRIDCIQDVTSHVALSQSNAVFIAFEPTTAIRIFIFSARYLK
jgi:hypothetical protein